MLKILRIFEKILSRRQKRICIGLLFFLFIGSLLECVGMSLIIPAIAALADTSMGIYAANIFALMCGIYLIKNLYLSILKYVQINFIGKSRLEIQREIIDGTLESPYLSHMQKGTPELMQRLESDIQGAFRMLDRLLILCSDGMLVFALAVLMAMTSLPMTLAVLLLYGLILGIIQLALKPYLNRESMKAYQLTQSFQKWLLQTVSCIKIIKAEKLEDFFADNLKKTAQEAGERGIKAAFVQSLPHLIIEMVSICGILGIASIFLYSGADASQVLNQLAVFVLIAVRMLPSISRINGSINSLNWNRTLLERTAKVLLEIRNKEIVSECKKVQKDSEQADFRWKKMELKDLVFQYPDTEEPVLEQLNLTIHNGKMLGVMGLSGAGKTTLVDIMLGLLKPQQGTVCIDGRNIFEDEQVRTDWSSKVSYIPQSISLLDGTIRENILFGRKDSGDIHIWNALKEAQLEEYVKGLPEGLETHVGEYGIRLSGGQRQRIGLARAFYKEADIFVLDEATAALDYGTEQKIIGLLQKWKGRKTILMITHRIEVLDACDEVIAVSGRKAEKWERKKE